MIHETDRNLHRLLGWIIHKNPTYLISACLTAVGARLLLVDPANPTGDINLILVTLGLLQVYEWTVSGILIALHHARRSPEDRASLLLVAAAFWTGPIAATIEMIALRPQLGLALAIGVCLIAMGELRLCCKILQLRMSLAGQVCGCLCVVFLTAIAPLLKTPELDTRMNEVHLYYAWWVFAVLVLGCLGVLRAYRKETLAVPKTATATASTWTQEVCFLGMTIVASGVHLFGMNYAFYCHAKVFYASPMIVALSVVGMEALSVSHKRYRSALTLLGLLPAIAIIMALQPFDNEVPIEKLPGVFRDPMLCVSIVAGVAWWFGYRRHRSSLLLHACCAAFALAAILVTIGRTSISYEVDRHHVIKAFYGIAAYWAVMAMVLRSRCEALFAILFQLAATTMLVWGKSRADGLIVCCAVGWSGLIAVHLVARDPRFLFRIIPVTFLAIAPWMCKSAAEFRFQVATHAAVLAIVVFLAGHFWRWTRYRIVAALIVVGHCLAALVAKASESSHPEALLFVFAGFCVLGAGALISWHKNRLLSLVPRVKHNNVEVAAP